MINWRVRIKNKLFWTAIIPAVLLLIQAVAKTFGIALNLGNLGDNLLSVVNAVFGVLAIMGIVADPTTQGVCDSTRALTYNEPK